MNDPHSHDHYGVSRDQTRYIPRYIPEIFLGVLFSLLTISVSMETGKLSHIITFDDIGYFAESAARMQGIYEGSLKGFIQQYRTQPPHAVVSMISIVGGFLAFGIREWAPAAFSTVWVVLFLIVLRKILADMPQWAFSSLSLVVLSWPVTATLVLDARPDPVSGLLLAGGLLWLTATPWLTASKTHAISVGALFGAALLAKPTFFPVAVALYFAALFIATVSDGFRANEPHVLGDFARSTVLSLVTTGLIIAPHYAFAMKNIIGYITEVSFGDGKHLWDMKASIFEHLLYYVSGSGAKVMMGKWVVVTFIFAVIAALINKYKLRIYPQRRIFAFFVACFVTYLSVSLPAHKNVWLGMILTWMCMIIFIASFDVLLRFMLTFRKGRLFAGCLCLSLVAFGATEFKWHHQIHQTSNNAAEMRDRKDLLSSIVDGVLETIKFTPNVYFSTATPYLNAFTLRYALIKESGRSAYVLDAHRTGDISIHKALITQATHVVTFSADDADLLSWLPSSHKQQQIRELVKADSRLKLLRSLPAPVSGGSIEVYVRQGPFIGVTPQGGFLPVEGPYPQWSLPRIVWANAEGARVRIDTTQGGNMTVVARAAHSDQAIRASMGDTSVGICRLKTPTEAYTCHFSIPSNHAAVVELHFDGPIGPADPDRAMMFMEISFAPE